MSWVSVSDIEGMQILKLSEHPQIILQIEVMKTEVITYQTLADSIKPLRDTPLHVSGEGPRNIWHE
jgi:hypothetical protein